jgi:hypothetical protein
MINNTSSNEAHYYSKDDTIGGNSTSVQLISGGVHLRGADLGRKLIVWSYVNLWWLPKRNYKKRAKQLLRQTSLLCKFYQLSLILFSNITDGVFEYCLSSSHHPYERSWVLIPITASAGNIPLSVVRWVTASKMKLLGIYPM